jgi:hypothetical protein
MSRSGRIASPKALSPFAARPSRKSNSAPRRLPDVRLPTIPNDAGPHRPGPPRRPLTPVSDALLFRRLLRRRLGTLGLDRLGRLRRRGLRSALGRGFGLLGARLRRVLVHRTLLERGSTGTAPGRVIRLRRHADEASRRGRGLNEFAPAPGRIGFRASPIPGAARRRGRWLDSVTRLPCGKDLGGALQVSRATRVRTGARHFSRGNGNHILRAVKHTRQGDRINTQDSPRIRAPLAQTDPAGVALSARHDPPGG